MGTEEAVDTDVIIVGGAVAGSALANALGSRSISALLIEKVSREVHSTRGDILHPPTLRILDHWGVLDALHADGALQITELGVTHRELGLLARFSLRAQGDGPASRTIAVPHDRIEAVLYECATRWPSITAERGVVTGLIAENGRVAGVRWRPAGGAETAIRAKLVAGCDGSQSLVRPTLGIAADQHPYEHEQVIIAAVGPTELPAALHWHIDDVGALCVVSRPREQCRILLTLPLGARGDLLRGPDPGLHDYVAARFPMLTHLAIRKANAYVYRLAWHVADRFSRPGAVLVGDSAHATHPAGATGMSLAISGAEQLARQLEPVLKHRGSDLEIDRALEAYADERRPAAASAVGANHEQALRVWQSDLFRDPRAYAAAIDPNASWGARGAAWGEDPAALSHAAS